MVIVTVYERRRVSRRPTRAWMHAGSCRCMHPAVRYEWVSVVCDSCDLSAVQRTIPGLQRQFANS